MMAAHNASCLHFKTASWGSYRPRIWLHRPHQRAAGVTVRATAAPVEKEKPDWTGDSILSRLVNAAINSPAFDLMKLGAREVMKSTARKRGVPWAEHVRSLEQSEVYKIKEEIEDKTIAYPSYYTMPFHAYDDGNLNWLAAFEVEPVTEIMAMRTFKDDTSLTPRQALDKLRRGILDHLQAYYAKHGLAKPTSILDIGCSAGVSTRYLAAEFPQASVTGLDLSPHFLAVAELRERQAEGQRQRIAYVHQNMEATQFPDASFDLVSVQFVIHECPADVIINLVRECRRLVKPGGIVMLADNNPQSKTIQNLPPVLFTLMKSTEPWSDQYYAFDLEACMREAGLKDVVTEEADHRHRAVFGHV